MKPHELYEFGPFRLDATEGVLTRRGEPVHLTPKALKLLLVLVQYANHIVDKDELMREVWPDTVVEETNLAGNIYALRQVFGEEKNEERYIETVPKRGYRFVAKVQRLQDERVKPIMPGPSTAAVFQGAHSGITEPPISANSLNDVSKPQRPGGLLRNAMAGVGVLCVVTAGAIFFWGWTKPKVREPNLQITSIAVLPLKNLSGDGAQEYFVDGMTEAMINELAKIRALRVTSRTSIMQYKDASKKIPEIGRELNVDAVVEGSVMRSGDQVRVTAQIVHVATDEFVWAESYERDLRDVLTLQRELARGIASQIRIQLTTKEQEQLTRKQPINPAAHEAYLKGLYHLNRAINTSESGASETFLKRSLEYFQQAIVFDSGYALPHSALARSYHWWASSSSPQYYPKAKEAALKALELDATLAEAHGALAFSIWRHDWNFAEAENEFKKGEELNPNSANWGYAQFLSTLGRHDQALQRFRQAQDVDPLTLPLKVSAGFAYLDARQYDQAIAQFTNTAELDSGAASDSHYGLCVAHVLKEDHELGIAECHKAFGLSPQPRQKAELAWAFAMAGRRAEARKILNTLKDQSKQKSISDSSLAKIYSALGERDLAFAELEKAYARHGEELLWLKVHPQFDGLRSDPRFNDLLRRIGFPSD